MVNAIMVNVDWQIEGFEYCLLGFDQGLMSFWP